MVSCGIEIVWRYARIPISVFAFFCLVGDSKVVWFSCCTVWIRILFWEPRSPLGNAKTRVELNHDFYSLLPGNAAWSPFCK